LVIFEYVSMQNFMAVGSAPLTIKLNGAQTTLVTAKNGAGKSSITADSLCFALYGKAYRNINKPTLVNSINLKKCLVEVGFSVGKKKYVVKRGMKPTVFEIYEDNVLINQDPDSRDYQKVLEQQILKMNYRAFTQVAIIGSASFVPFMKLKAEHRREFIEDLLDIRVFSVMNKALSVKVKEVKDELKLVVADIATSREIISIIENHVESRKDETREKIKALTAEKAELQANWDSIFSLTGAAEAELAIQQEKLKAINTYVLAKNNAVSSLNTAKINLSKYLNELTSAPEVCHACSQHLPHEHVQKNIDGISLKIADCRKKIALYEVESEKMDAHIIDYDLVSSAVATMRKDLQVLNEKSYGTSLLIKKINRDLLVCEDELSAETPDRSKLKDTAKKIVKLMVRKKELLELQQIHSAAQALLQDSGIKAKIIKQYIPTINKLVNKYLHQLDLFVNFNLDENFNEVVKSRHRDTFTYDSFSEGEKQRISLSLIFTWRAIAAMKNSVSTNLLILDEVADASMDADGFDHCINLFHSMKKNNLFIVSHRDAIAEKFTNVLRLVKKHNFTEIET